MKIRRITLEVEVPWFVSAAMVQMCLATALDAIPPYLHQEQVIKDELSPNQTIGTSMKYAMKGTNKHPKRRIDFFGGKYHFLCNFYECSIVYDWTYGSSEAAFAAQKTTDQQIRALFCKLDPSSAKALGRSIPLRPDWDDIKYLVMQEVVQAKFSQHHDLAEKLLATGTAKLEEGNIWGDRIWGTVDGVRSELARKNSDGRASAAGRLIID